MVVAYTKWLTCPHNNNIVPAIPMPRPKLSLQDSASATINLRVRPAVKEELQAFALGRGMKLSQWILDVCRRAMKKHT